MKLGMLKSGKELKMRSTKLHFERFVITRLVQTSNKNCGVISGKLVMIQQRCKKGASKKAYAGSIVGVD